MGLVRCLLRTGQPRTAAKRQGSSPGLEVILDRVGEFINSRAVLPHFLHHGKEQ